MNKNSRQRRVEAHKNYVKGNSSTEFGVPQTMSGGSLGQRKLTITVGFVKNSRKRGKVGSKLKPSEQQTEN